MSADHNHAIPSTQNEKVLWAAFALTTTFLIVEAVAGILLNSLALLSDAAHMFTDSAALGIALAAVRIARKPADQYRTYGYHRFEILAATFNALLLFGVAIYILYEAWQRFQSPVAVQSVGMMLVASLGLIINFISIRLLSSGKDKSLNLKGAYLEVWSDLVGSIGVIVGGAIIYFTGLAWVDTVVAVGIGLWVIPRTWILLKESLNLLLEGVPLNIDIQEVEKEILNQKGVVSLHDLHLWGITSGKNSLTAHILMDGTVDSAKLINAIQSRLSDKFSITHTTLQCETTLCAQAEVCTFIDSSNVLQEHSHDH
ncbi:MAG: cation transporter [Methylotenera sp.]|nr:MAG: cation transporter [Methylotenera sp.]PPD49875.1 MAG: cation transporter [Methylotenera sp.]